MKINFINLFNIIIINNKYILNFNYYISRFNISFAIAVLIYTYINLIKTFKHFLEEDNDNNIFVSANNEY